MLRRSLYRHPDEPINTSEYDVSEIAGDDEARTFVVTHHYAGSYPAARFRFGLYRRGHLEGVAVFSVPCSNSVLANVFPLPFECLAELGRFVLLDSVPGNGETWFLARCFAALRSRDLSGIVSFSDPLPRRRLDGTIVHKGHPGNHKYAWALDRAAQKSIPPSLPFPKLDSLFHSLHARVPL